MNEKRPTIVCAGMLDTKGDEIRYLASQVAEFGGSPLILDLSLGREADWADIKLGDVLACVGADVETVTGESRSDASEVVGKAGAEKIMQLYQEGLADGMISWAGSMGTETVTYAMRALPVGVPKIMLCTAAASDVSRWLGVKDIYIANPISEKGVNKITKKTVRKAVAGVVAMAKVRDEDSSENPLAAITLYGTTTPAAIRCSEYLTAKGWDNSFFHQTGLGMLMEELIRSGEIKAVFELTPGELSNGFYNETCIVDPKTRLTAAFDMGIPSVVAPGGLDQIVYGCPYANIPEKMKREYAEGKRVSYKNTGKPYSHNSGVTVCTPTLEETEELSEDVIRKISEAKGPAAFLLPMRGWSAYDQSEQHAAVSKEMGWTEGGAGPLWIPDTDRPEWSARAVVMREVFEKDLKRDYENLDVLILDMHLLDREFSDLACRIMGDMLDGTWRKGKYKNDKGVLAGL